MVIQKGENRPEINHMKVNDSNIYWRVKEGFKKLAYFPPAFLNIGWGLVKLYATHSQVQQ